MNIFAPAGGTGATGGRRKARQDNLEETNLELRNVGQDIQNKTKQEEFWDFVDATEHRQKVREGEMSSAQTVIDTEEERTERVSQEEQTDAAVAEANRKLIPAKTQQQLDAIHKSMNDAQFDQVTRAYSYFDEGVRAGQDPAMLFDQSRAAIVNSFPNPQDGEAYLQQYGIGNKFNEQNINKLSALSTYGVHNAATTRAEHLINVEWDRRAQEARIAAKGAKAEDMRTKFLGKEERAALGNMFNSYSTAKGEKWFDNFRGTYDADTGLWMGAKGEFVDTVSLLSVQAQTAQILGDANVTPFDYQRIAGDMMSMASEQFTESGWFWGTTNTGDEFHGNAFMNAATTLLGHLEVEREALSAAGIDMDTYELWKDRGPALMKRMDDNHQRMVDAGIKPATGSPIIGGEVGAPGNEDKEVPNTPKTPKISSKELPGAIRDARKAVRDIEAKGGKGSSEWRDAIHARNKLLEQRRKQPDLGQLIGDTIDFATQPKKY